MKLLVTVQPSAVPQSVFMQTAPKFWGILHGNTLFLPASSAVVSRAATVQLLEGLGKIMIVIET